MVERDEARTQAAEILAEIEAETGSSQTTAGRLRDMEQTLDYLAAALRDAERRSAEADAALTRATELVVAKRLCELSGNDKLFAWVRRGILNTVAAGNEQWEDGNLRLVNVPAARLTWKATGEAFECDHEWVRYDALLYACADRGDTVIFD